MRKSWRQKRKERIKERCAAAGRKSQRVQAAARLARAAKAQYCGTIRAHGPMFGGRVTQIRVMSDGLHVWADGLKRRTFRGFRAAMNRKLWGATRRTTRGSGA